MHEKVTTLWEGLCGERMHYFYTRDRRAAQRSTSTKDPVSCLWCLAAQWS